jgi:predicted RNA-binding protein Jag
MSNSKLKMSNGENSIDPKNIDVKKIEKQMTGFLSYFDPEVKVTVELTDSLYINAETKDAGLLIGQMGQTLMTLQYIVRLMVAKTVGGYVPLTFDVGRYKGKKEDELKELAITMAENVKNSGYPQQMRPMNSYDRRLVHVILKDFEGVEAVAIGEEPVRYIEIKPSGKE